MSENTERACQCRQPDCHACELAGIKGWLEAQGLHIVTAKQKAVLDAMSESTVLYVPGFGPVLSAIDDVAVCRAELARREDP